MIPEVLSAYLPQRRVTCVIAPFHRARQDVIYRYKIEAYDHRFESYEPYKIPEYRNVSESEPVIIIGSGPASLFNAEVLTLGLKPVILERGKVCP